MKSYLPLNGDWLFVTETPIRNNYVQRDLTAGYEVPEKVLASLTSNNIDLIKFIYERAKLHEDRIENISNQMRDKAKTLLGTVSFVSAIFFGIISFFTPSTLKLPWWFIFSELSLFILLACQMIRSLMIAMEVMTREESIVAPPDEFLRSYENGNETENAIITAYKNAIAQTVAYPIQTHLLLKKRINRLILGQRAFQYGLFYFVLLIFIHVSCTAITYKNNQLYNSHTNAPSQEQMLKDLRSEQENIKAQMVENNKELSVLNKSEKKISLKVDELEAEASQLNRNLKRLEGKIK